MGTNGPRRTVTLSCFSCVHERSESYRAQGDSGHDVYCTHPEALPANAERRYIGDTTWNTPAWCPLRARAAQEPAGGA